MTRTTLEYARPAGSVAGRTDLDAHIRGARKVLERILGERVHLEVDVAPGLPPAGIDATALTQVLVNLASNARDAMPAGGTVRITAALHAGQGSGAELEILRGQHIDLRVIDTGVGMDEATRSHVFEAFYTTKAKPSAAHRGSGSGLGLSSVWLLVTAAGGTVKIASQPGAGTAFTVALPIAG
ncbi:MAG: ATP-binding protein [Chloroflexota bacterium]